MFKDHLTRTKDYLDIISTRLAIWIPERIVQTRFEVRGKIDQDSSRII